MNTNYNDPSSVVSFLEFGAVSTDPSIKKIYDFRTGQQAYDWFMHARYSADLACYVRMLQLAKEGRYAELGDEYTSHIHHRDDFSTHLSKWAALQAATNDHPAFYEHGQTLFGCIEGIELCDCLLRRAGVTLPRPELGVRQVRWEGFDISDFFNVMAQRLHQGYDVITSSALTPPASPRSVAFAKGVTLLYAIRSPEDFFSLFGTAECGVFDLSLSLRDDTDSFIGTGKQIRYLSLSSFLDAYQAQRPSGCEIRVRSLTSGPRDSDSRLFFEGVIGRSKDVLDRFVAADSTFRSGLNSALPELANTLLPYPGNNYFEWTEFSSFASTWSGTL